MLSTHLSSLIQKRRIPIELCEYLFEQDMAKMNMKDTDHSLNLWLHGMLINLGLVNIESYKLMIRRLVKEASLHAPYLNRRTSLDSLFRYDTKF